MLPRRGLSAGGRTVLRGGSVSPRVDGVSHMPEAHGDGACFQGLCALAHREIVVTQGRFILKPCALQADDLRRCVQFFRCVCIHVAGLIPFPHWVWNAGLDGVDVDHGYTEQGPCAARNRSKSFVENTACERLKIPWEPVYSIGVSSGTGSRKTQ